jgi:tyrosyl-tRNA synthetase
MNKLQRAEELKKRGLITHEGGGTLEEIISKKRKMYLGVDPTADSLHAGNLVPIILLKHLSDLGNEPMLLVGGGTGLIGDPRESGERKLLDEKVANKNVELLRKQLGALLKKNSIKVVNNADWLKKVSLLDFLRDIGKHFSVNQLIKRDIIKRRLETEEDSISYTEFSYSLLQGFDFLHLNTKFGVDLQVGGSDQWANIISGVDLIRRRNGASAYALTTPIVVDKTTGKKFGKSEGNAVWLDPKKTSPFTFYQFWINVTDENVDEYLKIFSFMSLAQIEKTLTAHKAEPHKRLAQKALAKDVTTFVHGKDAATSAEKVSGILYGNQKVTKLSATDKKLILAEAPNVKLTKSELKKGLTIIDALLRAELATSKGDARKLLEGKAVSINGTGVALDHTVTAKDLKDGLALLKKGKKIAVLYS